MNTFNHFLSNNNILINLCYHLSIRDIVILSRTCQSLHIRLFNDGEVWRNRSLIFRPQDRQWLVRPKVIRQLIPTLPRHHDLQRLMIHDIPTLDIMTLFLIFDHCAHSINHLDLNLSLSQCHQLCMHLEAFCFHLATSQAWNKIPLTLHQYTLDSDQLYQQAHQTLKSSSQLYQPFFINQLIAHGLPTRMDDPPFEMLKQISITISTPTTFQHPPCDSIHSSSPSSSVLIQKFHHLTMILSRYSPALNLSQQSPYTPEDFSAPHTGTSIPSIFNPASATPDLSVSSSSSSITSYPFTPKSSSRINITNLIEKRQSSEKLLNTIKRKKSAKERHYYDRIELLSHQYHHQRPRSISNSPPPSPPTPPPHRDVSFLPSTRRPTTTPIVHVMRCQRPRSKK